MPEESDQTLVVAAQHGEPAALEQLAGRWWLRMRAWAGTILHSDRDADDAAQEAWIRVQRNLHRVDPERPFGAWLKTLTRNVARDVRGADARRPLSSDTLDELPFPGIDPERRCADRRAVGRALLAFDDLPARQREVLELVDIEGLTPTEAAARLDISPSAARASLTYARRAVRTRLLEDLP